MKARPVTNPGQALRESNRADQSVLRESERNRLACSTVKLTKILVPVDFSDCSRKALAYAVPFAEQFGASLVVLHVIPPYYAVDPYGLAQIERIEAELEQNGRSRLTELVIDTVPSDINAGILLRHGRATAEIVDAAKELEIDLIIISTHGHTGLKHVVFGSTAENVIRHAPCPVLTVREKEHEFIGN